MTGKEFLLRISVISMVINQPKKRYSELKKAFEVIWCEITGGRTHISAARFRFTWTPLSYRFLCSRHFVTWCCDTTLGCCFWHVVSTSSSKRQWSRDRKLRCWANGCTFLKRLVSVSMCVVYILKWTLILFVVSCEGNHFDRKKH